MRTFTVIKEVIPVYEYDGSWWAGLYYGEIKYHDSNISHYYIDNEEVNQDYFEEEMIEDCIKENKNGIT